MTIPKIFTVTGEHFTYMLRRVQMLLPRKAEVPEELTHAIQECTTTEELIDFFFTTDYYVDETFIRLFEKRLQELDCPF